MKTHSLKAAYLVLILALFVSGCTGVPAAEKRVQQDIVISGSGSGTEILKPLAEAFGKKNPEITVRFLAATTTGDGITGAGEGTLDIGSIARKMKDSEKAKYQGLAENIFVRDAMILAVNPKLNITGLTSGKVREIHAGNITDWSGAGGPAGRIILLDREESESSKQILRKEILGDMAITSNAILMYSAGATNEAIEDNEFAIGQSSLGSIKMLGLKIKPLAIDGVMPSPDTVKSGEYKMVREYGIVYKKEGASDAAKKFVDYIFSDEAAQILSGYGFVPVPK